MSVKNELLEIKGDNDLLQVETVYDWVTKHPKSELYQELEWDDVKAGREYRYWQIRRLIAIHVRFEDRPAIRQLVSLSIDRNNKEGGGYRDFTNILNSRDLYEVMLNDALRELERLQAKYDNLKDLEPVWRAVGKIRSRSKAKTGGEQGRRSTA